MKKLLLMSLAGMVSVSLAGCANNQNKNKAVYHKAKTHQVKKDKDSSSENSDTSSESSSVSSTNTNNNSSNASTNPDNNDVSTNINQTSNGLPPYTDIHDFINKYGVSPKRYLIEHGANPQQAANEVPETDKTTGEIMTEDAKNNPNPTPPVSQPTNDDNDTADPNSN